MIYLSVIVPVRNEERFISATLASLIEQDYPRDRFELLVVDGRSTDRTRQVVREIMERHSGTNIRLLDNPRQLSSAARNIGIEAAAGELVAVIDGHVHLPDRLLFRNMESLREAHGARALSRPAPLDVPGLTSGSPFWIAVARKSRLGHSTKSFIYSDHEGFVDPVSAGFAYDRSVFQAAGCFDEEFDAAEDVEFHHRVKKAGIMAYTSPALLIYSYPRDSLLSLFRQQTRYGVGRARLVRKHPESFTKETLVPVGIFALSLAAPVAALSWPVAASAAAPVLALFLAYAALVLATGVTEALRRGRLGPGLYVALAIWTTHFGLGWGFCKTMTPRHCIRNLRLSHLSGS